jgi:hypothetical protein
MRHARVIAALAGVVIALTACGDGSDDGSGGGSGSAKTSFEGDSAQQVLDKALAATKSASSVHLKGSNSEEGSEFELDLVLSDGKGAQGTIGFGGEKVELVQLGDVIYIKGGPTAALGEKFADKWIKSSTKDEGAQEFRNLTSIDAFFTEVLKPDGTITRVDGKDVDGKKTVGLQDSKAGDEQGTLYISADGKAYPLLIATKGQPQGMQFTEWDQPVTIKAPPASKVVDQKDVTAELGNG